MSALINRLVGRPEGSRDDARERLKTLLIHDQVDLTPGQMQALKHDVMEVLSRYVHVDAEHTVFRLAKGDAGVELIGTIPVTRVIDRGASTQAP